jgi:hypothetical protein
MTMRYHRNCWSRSEEVVDDEDAAAAEVVENRRDYRSLRIHHVGQDPGEP